MREIIEKAWKDRSLLKDKETVKTIEKVIESIDAGELRCAEPTGDGWKVNEWVKKAVVLYFPTREMETIEVGPFEFHDKMKLKKDYKEDLFKLAAKRKQERQQKVESKLKEEFANELNGCTFRPSILRTFDLSPKVERPTMTPPKRYSTSITRLSPVSSFAAKLNAEESQEPK